MSDFRSLCADLYNAWAKGDDIAGPMMRARAELAKPVAPPSGYAYRYPTADGSVIRFNHGQEVNGSRPLYAVPYWLGQPPGPTPIPVAERLPGEGDCAPWPDEPDATPWCWFAKEVDGGWEWYQLGALQLSTTTLSRIIAAGGWTHWLPANALPLPATPGEEP